MIYSLLQRLSGSFLSIATITIAPGVALAEKADIEFLPLEVKEGFVCAENTSNQESFEFWLGWDRENLPDWALNDIRRDLGRLISHKASEQSELIKTIISKLEQSSEAYERHHALVDLIKLDLQLSQSDLSQTKLHFDDALQVTASMPPVSKNFMSNLILRKVFDAPAETGLDLKISAANEGDADALFELTNYQEHPFVQDVWGINSEITVLLAFGSLLGEYDENYCNRARKIAREYADGNYVKRDLKASIVWYQHLAELGDVSSAWKVAELNMFGPKDERDEALVSDYLMKAYRQGYEPAVDGVLKYIKSEDYAKAHLPMMETILVEAAEKGHSNALNALVRYYKTGQPFGYQSEKLTQLLERQYLSGNAEAALQLAIEMMQVSPLEDDRVKKIVLYLETAMESTNNSTKAIAFNLLRSLPKTAAIDASNPTSINLSDKEAS